MGYQVSVSFELKIETGSYAEAVQRALDRIKTGTVQPEYLSVYPEREEKE